MEGSFLCEKIWAKQGLLYVMLKYNVIWMVVYKYVAYIMADFFVYFLSFCLRDYIHKICTTQ